MVECQEERSQHKNRAKALSLLASRLQNAELEKQQKSMAETRKSLVAAVIVPNVSAPTTSLRAG